MPISQSQKTTTTILLKCDQCNTEISYVEEDLEKDPLAMPEAAVRFLALSRMSVYGIKPGTLQKVALCSKFCALEYFKDYEPARKPTEEELAKLKEESSAPTN